MGFRKPPQTRQQDLDRIPHTIAGKTVGFGWDAAHNGRQDSRIWIGFRRPWQTRQQDLDWITHTMADKIVRKLHFEALNILIKHAQYTGGKMTSTIS